MIVTVPTQSQLRIEEIIDELDESEKIAVLDNEKDEFYTLEELDNMDKPMTYLARKL